MLLRGLLLAAFLGDFPKTLAIDRQLLPRVLSHLLGDLKPVYRHTIRILAERWFSNTKTLQKDDPAYCSFLLIRIDDFGEFVQRPLRIEES
jgi:hypothetical protein